MPNVLVKNGFRFFFYSREGKYKPAHVHIEYQGGMAVFWLDPVSLREQKGMTKKWLDKARKIVIEYREDFLEKYHGFFKRR